MPDFHVVALRYRLQPGDHVSYPNPPPLAFENEVARFGLEKNQLRCEMKLHVTTSEEARALAAPVHLSIAQLRFVQVRHLCFLPRKRWRPLSLVE